MGLNHIEWRTYGHQNLRWTINEDYKGEAVLIPRYEVPKAKMAPLDLI